MTERLKMTASQGFRLANKSSAVPKCKFPDLLRLYHDDGTLLVTPKTCGECVPCRNRRTNEILGKIAAHCLSCFRVDFYTLTYDDSHSIEARNAARIRHVKHIQDFQKRLREQERYNLLKYNDQEQRDAQREGRKPRLVDPTKSYIKFFVAFEQGEKKGRNHWHVITLYESHFPIDDKDLLTTDWRHTDAIAERVWMPPAIHDHETKHMPPDAANPKVLDFRSRKRTGKQLWAFWPWGMINVQCVTHDVQTPANIHPLKSPADLRKSVQYIAPYTMKQNPLPAGLDPRKKHCWTDRQHDLYNAPLGVQRTQSRGLGVPLAEAIGRQHANTGVQLKTLEFTIEGLTLKRSHASTHTFQQKVIRNGGDEFTAHQLTDNRVRFPMTGAMRQAAFTAYEIARTERTGKPLKISALSRPMIGAKMEAITRECREFLNSHKAQCLRATQTSVGRAICPLPDAMKVVDVFGTDQHGRLMTGGEYGNVASKRKVREPLDRYYERQKNIDAIYAAYKRAEQNPCHFRKVEAVVSEGSLDDLLTERMLENRPRHQRNLFLRSVDEKRVFDIQMELLEKKSNGDTQAAQDLEYLDNWLQVEELAHFGHSRHDLHSPLVPNETLWNWINHRSDFQFPRLKEELIQRFAHVIEFPNECRAVITANTCAIQRRVFSDEKATFKCPNTGRIIRHAKFSKWATRCVDPDNDGEMQQLFEGTLPNRSPADNDTLFIGPEPLKPVDLSVPLIS